MNNEKLIQKILNIVDKIAKNSRIPSNYMIASPKLASEIKRIKKYQLRSKKLKRIMNVQKK